MNCLVVYDSVFGNTAQIAQRIGAALDVLGNAVTLPVGQVTAESMGEVDVLIVGSPTRGFRPTEGITQFLNALNKHQLEHVAVAAFDTRIALDTIQSSVFRFIVDKGGYAANTIAQALHKKGGKLLVPPEGFIVTGEQGPLQAGELERAADWAKRVVANR